ncbi:MAG: HD domain-containing protein [Firmicutes bacterium]|nr:HD domain-containing protein [Bacillota bacterium]
MILRDSVFGDMTLSERECQLIDTPWIQRLRRIKQLGTAALVYPGCTHTRFEHSLGTMQKASEILGILQIKHPSQVSEEFAASIRAAALLHDVTHVPFGHTLEDERHVYPRHDSGVRLRWLWEDGLRDATALAGYDTDLIWSLLSATSPQAWTYEIFSGALDADMLDYVSRDAMYAGLSVRYDQRILQAFSIANDHLTLEFSEHGLERSDRRSEVLQILHMRYYLTERLYYHHTKCVSGAMIAKAVEWADQDGVLTEQALLQMGDESLLDCLEEIPDHYPHGTSIRALARSVRERHLLKRAYALTPRTLSTDEIQDLERRFYLNAGNRRRAEEKLAARLDLPPQEVVFYVPKRSWMKSAAMPCVTPSGLHSLDEDEAAGGEVRALAENYRRLWRFYVFVPGPQRQQTQEVCERYFGHPSEYQVAADQVS